MIIVPVLRIYGVAEDKDVPWEIYDKIKNDYPEFLSNNETYQFSKDKIYLYIPFYNTLKSAEYIKGMIQKHKNLGVDILEITEYTEKEWEDADVYSLQVILPLSHEGTDASSYGTIYTNCCSECNIGGVPVKDVLVDRKFVKKSKIASLKNSDYFVSNEVKQLIENNELTGVTFEHMIRDYKGRDIQDLYLMSFDNILPPVDDRTLLNTSPAAYTCKKCGKIVPYLKSQLYYKNKNLEKMKDFNLSSEFFNNHRMPALIVSKRVVDALKKAKIRIGIDMINIVNEDGTITPGKM